ncbi:MAG: DUF4355 domain-containing protein [Clostridia bacterium]|nr:DUF4355 domain-containing protein [Clostridia bacterium]
MKNTDMFRDIRADAENGIAGKPEWEIDGDDALVVEESENAVNAGEGVDGGGGADAGKSAKYVDMDSLGGILDERFARWRGEIERGMTGEKLDKREEDIKRREAELVRRELMADAAKSLAEKGLPAPLSQVIDYSGRDNMISSIEAVEKAFRDAVRLGVDERIRRSRMEMFRSGQPANAENMSDEEYYRMRIGG